MLRATRAVAAGAAMLLLLPACTPTVVEIPDPAAIPSGEPIAVGAEATGPITVAGSGQALGLGWRYLIYESADGTCTELQLAQSTSTACGDPFPAEGQHLGGVSVQTLESGVTAVDGIASDEIFTVWIVDERVGRVPATLMPLEDAGLEGQAFVGFVPAEASPTHLQAVARSGEILQTYEVP